MVTFVILISRRRRRPTRRGAGAGGCARAARRRAARHAYYKTDCGRDACLDAHAALFRVVGASNRVTDPANPTDGRSIRATLGQFAFVSTKVRNVLELAAGERATSRAGGVGDGHFPMSVAEVRRMDSVFPSDGALERGLQLIDGAALERGLPQY